MRKKKRKRITKGT